MVDPGFMRVYQEDFDDGKTEHEEERILPPLVEGEAVDLDELKCNQHFTEPPPRYSEATLIKALEDYALDVPRLMPVLFLLCKIANTLFWKINDLNQRM